MKVQGPNGSGPVEAVRSRRDSSPARKPQKHGGERVEVSAEARALREARGPEVPDMLRVARLREALLKGAFKIDPERIADLMLQEETDKPQ
ncbi:MAG: flagellar biosynthesis anti-sigma factor FlgM [Deltaproteobacteria bacterium]|nr:flagellar biosynthesis anti-sigma factor FlgM [Deltaproteobacteria bacterium]